MKRLPIIMSAPMVLSLLAGSKTQTRRTRGLEDVPPDVTFVGMRGGKAHFERVTRGCVEETCDPVKSPYGVAGDVLYVREGVRKGGGECDCDQSYEVHPPGYHDVGCACWSAHYIADGRCAPCDNWGWANKALPAIHMPSGMCRFELELRNVTVERLSKLSEEDARAEGISATMSNGRPVFWWPGGEENYDTAKAAYRAGWEWLNGAGSWARDPWVWRLEFSPRKLR